MIDHDAQVAQAPCILLDALDLLGGKTVCPAAQAGEENQQMILELAQSLGAQRHALDGEILPAPKFDEVEASQRGDRLVLTADGLF